MTDNNGKELRGKKKGKGTWEMITKNTQWRAHVILGPCYFF